MSRLCVIVFLFSLLVVSSETWHGDFIEGVDIFPQSTDAKQAETQSAARSFFSTLFRHNTDGTERHGQRQPNQPTPVQSGVCFRTSGAVNMRSSPCGSSVVVLVPAGTTISGNGGVINGVACNLGNYPSWQPVSYSGRSGYIAASLLSAVSCGGTPPPPVPPPSGGSGSVVDNDAFKRLNAATQSALRSIADTCGATVTPTGGGSGHCDFSINKDYGTCFHAARTQAYLSNFEFIWHPGASHCSSGQHLHILSGYRSHGIDRLYPATSNDRQSNKPPAATWNSCQWLATITPDANWCCYRWF